MRSLQASIDERKIKHGNFAKVPCLKIVDGTGKSEASQWLYGSDKIIGYLSRRFDGLDL